MIRPLQPGDRAEWNRLWQGYLTFYGTALAPAVCDTTFRRLLDPAEPMHAALAFEAERAVGLAQYVFHRSTWTTGDYCYLQDLFVDAPARGAGFGRGLIEHVVAAAEAAGAARVHWLTHETNADAMLLYHRIGERSGFVQFRKLL